ncbi:hypothetical protein E2562_030072 [Oryza meyeriana var. granulata]|uniref:Uncharacterized protein n=1 Tax=Oryza meyeriana var. granulata TaxID=110450 RepID=A0A6G1CV33_9ORYZ|nr:hypothetical protein E2562_030072 [Oryza meyeriana var. granulata]
MAAIRQGAGEGRWWPWRSSWAQRGGVVAKEVRTWLLYLDGNGVEEAEGPDPSDETGIRLWAGRRGEEGSKVVLDRAGRVTWVEGTEPSEWI